MIVPLRITHTSTHPDVEITEHRDPKNPQTVTVNIKVLKAIPKGTAIAGLAAAVELRAVTNRGTTYLVPTNHLGQPLKDNTVQEVAKAGLHYLEKLVDEAGRL
jgi:hypothetical protein